MHTTNPKCASFVVASQALASSYLSLLRKKRFKHSRSGQSLDLHWQRVELDECSKVPVIISTVLLGIVSCKCTLVTIKETKNRREQCQSNLQHCHGTSKLLARVETPGPGLKSNPLSRSTLMKRHGKQPTINGR